MPTSSIFMNLQIPTIGGDSNAWGNELNGDLVALDALAVYNVVNVSASGALAIANGPALVKATGGGAGITLTLPDATVTANKGRVYIVVKVDSGVGAILLQGAAGQTLSGQASFTLSTQWSRISVQSDGVNWIVIAPIENTTLTLNGVLFGNGATIVATTAGGINSILTGPSFGAAASQLGSAQYYALLGGSGVTNTGSSTVAGGNVGSYPTNSVTGTAFTYTSPAAQVVATAQNQTDLTAAIVYFQGLTPTAGQTGLANLSTNNGGGGAGIYQAPGGVGVFSGGALTIPTSITLDAQNNPNAVFVFLASSSINLSSGQSILLINGAQAANVIWVAVTTFITAATSTVNGTILAGSGITLGGGTLNGRALVTTGPVTISSATAITVTATSATPSFSSTPIVTSLTTTGTLTVGTTLTAPTIISTVNLDVKGTLEDGTNAVGTSGQLLSSTGTGVLWVTTGIVPASGPVNSILVAGGSGGPVATQLGTAAGYAILAYAAVTNSDGANTAISGGNIASYPTGTVTPAGWTLSGGAAVVAGTAQAQTDLANAIVYYQGLTGATSLAASYASHTFTATATGYNSGPGFVGFASSTLLFSGGTITLDGANLANPIFVFQVGSALNVTTAATTISLINGATAANVVWVVGTTATFDAHNHVWAGNILAHTTITLDSTNSGPFMTLAGRALANTGAVTISDAVVITVPAGTASPFFSANPTVTTLTTTAAEIVGTSLTVGTNLVIGTTITSYNGIPTVANGVPAEYARVALSGYSTIIGAGGSPALPPLLYAVPSSSPAVSAMYRISWCAVVTQAASSSSTLGGATGFQITYTDSDTGLSTITPAAGEDGSPPNSNVSEVQVNSWNQVGAQASGVVVVHCASSSNINYSMGYLSSGGTVMKYALHIRLEAL